MIISSAQIKPIKGDVTQNIEKHMRFIEGAASYQVDFILFPELSLTGYEPELANELATGFDDERFAVFNKLSALHRMTIAIGMPIRQPHGVVIGMLVFEPGKEAQLYAKQMLHSDEEPYFVPGNEQVMLEIQNEKIAPAICYESLQNLHVEQISGHKLSVYAASVAKSASGIEKAYGHYPKIATQYEMTVLMSNSVGFCDNFESAGQSAVWDKRGNLAAQLDREEEGMLIFDTLSGLGHKLNVD